MSGVPGMGARRGMHKNPYYRAMYLVRKRAMKNEILFDLTLSDFYFLMFMARITPDQIGQGRNDYQLARFNDEGGYTRGNCRYITALENQRERKNVGNQHGKWVKQ